MGSGGGAGSTCVRGGAGGCGGWAPCSIAPLSGTEPGGSGARFPVGGSGTAGIVADGTLDSNGGEVVPTGGISAGGLSCEQPSPSASSAAEPRVQPTHVMDRLIERPPALVARPGVQSACPRRAVRCAPAVQRGRATPAIPSLTEQGLWSSMRA